MEILVSPDALVPLNEKYIWILGDIMRITDRYAVIGGWAVYHYLVGVLGRYLYSFDLDIIVGADVFGDVAELLESYGVVYRYTVGRDCVHVFMDGDDEKSAKTVVDVFTVCDDPVLPFDVGEVLEFDRRLVYSDLVRDYIYVVSPEKLLVAKMMAYSNRVNTIKIVKDLVDIISLILTQELDYKIIKGLVLYRIPVRVFIRNLYKEFVENYNFISQILYLDEKEVQVLKEFPSKVFDF